MKTIMTTLIKIYNYLLGAFIFLASTSMFYLLFKHMDCVYFNPSRCSISIIIPQVGLIAAITALTLAIVIYSKE